ncbi:hypothetical protein AeRB84_013054 [Aphanomyces euteiches]|nr:hypothetical protein AeRB84_013054 [Aphanomyces euteiches]
MEATPPAASSGAMASKATPSSAPSSPTAHLQLKPADENTASSASTASMLSERSEAGTASVSVVVLDPPPVKEVKEIKNEGKEVKEIPRLPTMNFESFYQACQEGNLASVRDQLDSGHDLFDVNAFTKTQDTPLCVACVEGRADVVAVLLANPAINVNLGNYSHPPLALAAGLGRLDIVKMLLNHPSILINVNTSKRTPLTAASENGHLEVVQLLCEQPGIEINLQDLHGHNALFAASLHGRTDVVRYLLTRPNIDVNLPCAGDLPLTVTASYHHVDIVRLLLAVPDIDVNKPDQDGLTALIHACDEGLDDVVQLLFDSPKLKIDKDILREMIARSVDKGRASVLRLLLTRHPLPNTTDLTMGIEACQKGHLSVVELFLELGLFQNDPADTKRLAVYEALANKHVEIARLLLKRDDFGQPSLLHVAASSGFEDIVKMLLPNKEDVGGLDTNDQTAWQLAAQSGHWNIVSSLLQADLPFKIQDDAIVPRSDHGFSWPEFADPTSALVGNPRRSELATAIVLQFPEQKQVAVAKALLAATDATSRTVESFTDDQTRNLLSSWTPSPGLAESPSRKAIRTPGAVPVIAVPVEEAPKAEQKPNM